MKHYLNIFLGAIVAFNVAFWTPTPARADFFGEVLDAAAQAGGWPADLPSPTALLKLIEIAQGCAGDTSESGLINCVNTAIQDPTIYNALGEDTVDKIDAALSIYIDISTGDYLHLILKLGKTAGCAAALVITGVPVCALAELIADLGKAIYEIGEAILEFLDGLGAHAKYTGDDWYEFYFMPNLNVGYQIQFTTPEEELPAKMASLTDPMWSGCYHYFRDVDDMSVKNANKTCNALRSRFLIEVNDYMNKLYNDAVKTGWADYDKQVPIWISQYTPKCEMPSGVAKDIDGLEEACVNKIKAAAPKGHDYVETLMHVCKSKDFLIYDTVACVKSAFKAKALPEINAAIKVNQDLVKAYNEDPNSAKNVLKAYKDWLTKYNYATAKWQEQCKLAGFEGNCRLELKNAYEACGTLISALPWSGDLGPSDKSVNAVTAKCEAGYTALVNTYSTYVKDYYKIMDNKKSCPTAEQQKMAFGPAAVQACNDTYKEAVEKCAGGEPSFGDYFKTGKISQVPLPKANSCGGENVSLALRWSSDESLLKLLDQAQSSAASKCGQMGGACSQPVADAAKECRDQINTQANITGISSASGLKKALAQMNSTADDCIKKVNATPQQVYEDKQLEALVTEQFGGQCPADVLNQKFNANCKNALVETIIQCKNSGISTAGQSELIKSQQQKIVNACKSQLDAVIANYKKKAALAETTATSQMKESGSNGVKVQLGSPAKAGDRGTGDKTPAQRGGLKSNLNNDATPAEAAELAHPNGLKAPVKGGRIQMAPPSADAPQRGGVPAQGPNRVEAPAVDPNASRGLPAVTPAPATSPEPAAGGLRPRSGGLNLPSAETPAQQMQKVGCTGSLKTRGGFECKTSEGMHLCEQLKTAGQVKSCDKVP